MYFSMFDFLVFFHNIVDTKWATAQTSLARYLRTYLGMTGTKIMCAQAGCGACVVTATHVNPATGEDMTHSINSVSWHWFAIEDVIYSCYFSAVHHSCLQV